MNRRALCIRRAVKKGGRKADIKASKIASRVGRNFKVHCWRVRQRRKRSLWSGKQRQVGSCLLGEQFKLHKKCTRSHLISLALDGSLRGSTSVIWVSFAYCLAGTSGTMVPGALSVSLWTVEASKNSEISWNTYKKAQSTEAFQTTTIIKAALGGAKPFGIVLL